MKPIIIYEKIKDGKVEITKERLEEIVEQSYNSGFEDGKRQPYITTTPYFPSWKDNSTITTTLPYVTSNHNTAQKDNN